MPSLSTITLTKMGPRLSLMADADIPNSVALPIELYHPAFASFNAVVADTSTSVPDDIVQSTAALIAAASQIKTAEAERQQTTRMLLTELLSRGVTQIVNLDRTSADHAMSFSRTTEPLAVATLLIVEEKSELGTGGDSSVQASFSYQATWIENPAISEISFCPSFIISIAGPWIVIMGAIFTSHIIVQRLTDFIWLGQARAIDDNRTLQLARIFYSLRLAIGRLEQYYDGPLLSVTPKQDRFFPLATSFRNDKQTKVEFHYLCPLKGPDPSCATFLVQRKDSDELMVVKFVERYGENAHRLLAENGLAPKLLYFGPVWTSGPEMGGCGPRRMVVMEHVAGVTAKEKYGSGRIPEAVCLAVLDALKLLHYHDLVHGDLRRPNIMIASHNGVDDHNSVMIIDFDWSGKAGAVRFPLHLSKTIRWPDGVQDYNVITKEHDLAIVALDGIAEALPAESLTSYRA